MSADIVYNSTGTFHYMYDSTLQVTNHKLLVARLLCNKLHQKDGHFSRLSSEEGEEKERNKQESKVGSNAVTSEIS